MLSSDEYFRKGHFYLETKEGRQKIFEFLERKLKTAFQENNLSEVIEVTDHIYNYIKKSSLIYTNFNYPNLWTLRDKSDEIKDDALKFLKVNIDLFKKAIVMTNKASYKSILMLLLIKSLPEIENLSLKHYIDLYLLIFNTLLFLDKVKGSDEDLFDLGDMMVRASFRYDCNDICGSFIINIKVKDIFNSDEYKNRFVLYKNFNNRINKVISSTSQFETFDINTLAFFIFIDVQHRLKYLRCKTILWETLSEEILSYIMLRIDKLYDERMDELYDEKKWMKDKVYVVLYAKLQELKQL